MAAAIKLSADEMLAVEKEYCERRLVNFVREAWGVLEPATPYLHNWHIDIICEHLEAVTDGQINRLLINVPPGTMKSLLTGVFWPAWEWAKKPEIRWVSASHAENYALRDARRMRQLVTSDWYQSLWPLSLAADQNAAGKYENEHMGFRHAMPVRSMTGSRGDRVLWDDPHSVEGALSPAELATTGRIFHETLPTRLNSPEYSAIVIIMQRLAVNDVSGLALEEEHGYEHLMLPMELEVERRCTTSIGFTDPRTREGELLFPDRFPAHVVERDKKMMGTYAVAGQFQQRPSPRGGGMFPVANVKIMAAAPLDCDIEKSVRYWDKAGTEGGGAYTAGVLMHKLKDGRFVVADRIRGQWQAHDREKRIKQTARIDGPPTRVWIEQEPGSGGKESAENTIRNLSGYVVRADRVTGDKETRAEGYSVQFEQGNVWLVRGEWNKEFLSEHETFPVGKFKDQVDAAAGAFSKLAANDKQFIGFPAVTTCMDRDLEPAVFAHFSKMLGVYVRQGDGTSVIIRRQGPKVWMPKTFGAETGVMELAGYVIDEARDFGTQTVFVNGVGEAMEMVARLRDLGVNVVDVQDSEAPVDDKRFKDRRTGNWYRMRDYLSGEVDLPAGANQLRSDLTAPEYTLDSKQRMVLESIEAMGNRVVMPPTEAEALAFTFAEFQVGGRRAKARNVRKVKWA